MVCILNSNTDPYFNAAAEEFLLKKFDSDCFMLWQNTPSVFIGKHQNAIAEINYHFITHNNIPVIRRLSGGGSVFHDTGNINFSFITHAEKGKAINFQTCLKPIVNFLHSKGVKVEINSRNNLFIGDKKITGTAAHIYKNKVIHHGTLLFDSSEDALLKALEADTIKYSDKAVKSVKSPVTNILQHITQKMNIHEFITALKKALKKYFCVDSEYSFTDPDKAEIEKLSKNKYQTWEWNFGYSPAYSFQNKVIVNNQATEIRLEIKKGIIEKADISGERDFQKIKEIITGLPHQKNILNDALKIPGHENWSDFLF